MDNPISNLTKRERLGVAAFAGILALVVLGGWTYRKSGTPPVRPALAQAGMTGEGGIVLSAAKPTPTPTPVPPKELIVYVTGAVKRPDVYSFKSGERLYHAIRKAGGFRSDAVQDALNLADRLKDADQIHVPTKPAPKLTDTCSSIERSDKEVANPKAAVKKPVTSASAGRVVGRSAPAVAVRAAPQPEPKGEKLIAGESVAVNLNKADAEQLQRLPGIGPAMAERILAFRKEVGGFQRVEDLQEVRGIGEKTFARLKELVTI
jgi:competence protein ComEA